jgi:hypothetical protein
LFPFLTALFPLRHRSHWDPSDVIRQRPWSFGRLPAAARPLTSAQCEAPKSTA